LVFLLSGLGSTDDGEEDVATEEGSEGSEESGGDEASSGDVDAEGIARDNCASCHGQDFSGGMGPALAGTSLAEEDFTTTVREGRGSMTSFSADHIEDDEITVLYQFFSEQ